jgi:CheY-like chemotaxis protein
MHTPVFARLNVYHCAFCGASNTTSESRWCACGTSSLICTACAQCFCEASPEWQAEFWRQAPQEIRAGHLLDSSSSRPEHNPYESCVRPLMLVVDDDSVIHAILIRLLASFPGTVLHARDGHQALAIARRARPDLLLTDALLPGVDGRVVAKTLKLEPATSAMRVVVMSGLYKGARYRNEAFREFHADAYLEKPVTAASLAEVIEKTLHVRLGTVAPPVRQQLSVKRAAIALP